MLKPKTESLKLSQRGFTLVELLVVIAIIAILFAVVLVAINPAQRFKDSRNARRLSDVQSIVGATTTYTADKRGTPPADIPDGQCIGAKPATVITDPGPQAHWQFDNNANDTAGASGGPFNGTTSEATYPAAKLSQGLALQNSIYGVSVANTIGNPTNALTLEGWIKLNQKVEPGTFDRNQAIFDKGNYRMQLNSDSGKLELETQNGSAWSLDYDTSSTTVKGINTFAQFQGSLYAGGINTFDQGVLLKKSGGIWSVVSDYPTGQPGINSLAVYNRKLYSGQTGGRVYVFDGTVWQNTNLEALTGSADVLALTQYRGKLYAGLGTGKIWLYDGMSWSLSHSFDSATEAAVVYAMTVFNGKLYIGTGRGSANQEARLFEFDGNTWTQRFFLAKDAALSLVEHNKELYIGFGGDNSATDAVIYKGDGVTFSQIGSALSGSTAKSYAYSLGVFNGILFAGIGGSAGDGDVYFWDGSTWNIDLNNASSAEIRSLYSYQGKLYAGGRGANAAQSGIWAYGSNGFLESQKSTWYPNVWYHIAGVYDGSNTQMKLIINGSVDSTRTGAPSTITLNTSPLYLGIGYGSDAFSGVIDDFAVHHSVLSDTTIATHAGCYNLGQYLVSEYMGALPIDPSSSVTDGSDTGYFISKDPGGVVTITALLTEITSSIPELIKASR